MSWMLHMIGAKQSAQQLHYRYVQMYTVFQAIAMSLSVFKNRRGGFNCTWNFIELSASES